MVDFEQQIRSSVDGHWPGRVVRMLGECSSDHFARLVARLYQQAGADARCRLLADLLRRASPMTTLALAGGVFARFAVRARWSDVSLSEADLSRIRTDDVRRLADHLRQAEPQVVDLVASWLAAAPHRLRLMTALGEPAVFSPAGFPRRARPSAAFAAAAARRSCRLGSAHPSRR
ncbi:MAG: hypothetical protein QM766_23815 [Burkholderiaceae bacterium]